MMIGISLAITNMLRAAFVFVSLQFRPSPATSDSPVGTSAGDIEAVPASGSRSSNLAYTPATITSEAAPGSVAGVIV